MSDRVDKKIRVLEKERLHRKDKRLKDEELREYIEEAFDSSTLKALYELMNKGVIDEVYGPVGSGKEAVLLWGKNKEIGDIAIKVFLKETSDFKKSIKKYIQGDPRFEKVSKKIRNLIKVWCLKEFRNLQIAYKVSQRTPQPIASKENILVMTFIGDNGNPAPLIKDLPPRDPEKAYRIVMEAIEKIVVEGKIVHADLSEYNILNWNENLYIIDWGSAVHLSHPMALYFLKRDLENISNFFRRLGVEVVPPDVVYSKLLKKIRH